ncbi:MAG: radical SAM protein [Myxococcota bacterium]|jgi:MoaA/NifB/PqqE/SkfB family radical SAM enzyme|nr:radical SAM protein [Myxococcota bacterium]
MRAGAPDRPPARGRPAGARSLLRRARLGPALAAAALAGRRRPLFVGWSLTDRCTEACAYCGRHDRGSPELPRARALGLVDEFRAAGVARVSLTGGEPLLHRPCLDLIEALRRAGIAVSLNSNGALVPRHLERLTGSLSGLVLSVDGGEAAHDAVRGTGSWRRAVAGARVARRVGIPLSLHMVITAANLDQISPVLGLAGELDARVGFTPIEDVPAMGRRDLSDLRPDPARWRALVDELLSRLREGDRRIQNSAAGLRYLRHWPVHAPTRCSAGRVYARIEPDGSLYGCGNLVLEGDAPTVADRPFAAAFAALPRQDCRACWCDTRVEMNLILGGSPSAIRAAWAR